jgi:hypothetical protein
VDAPGQDHMSRYSIHTTTTTISISVVVFVGGVLSFAPQQREGDGRRERIKIGVGVGEDHFAGFSMVLFLWLTFFVLWRLAMKNNDYDFVSRERERNLLAFFVILCTRSFRSCDIFT